MYVAWRIHICDMTHSYMPRDLFIYATRLIHMCDMTHPCAWYDSFVLLQMCDMTDSLAYIRHDAFMCATQLIDMCAIMHSCVRHNLLICVPSCIHVCDTSHRYVCHHAFMCATQLIDMCAIMPFDAVSKVIDTCALWCIHVCNTSYWYLCPLMYYRKSWYMCPRSALSKVGVRTIGFRCKYIAWIDGIFILKTALMQALRDVEYGITCSAILHTPFMHAHLCDASLLQHTTSHYTFITTHYNTLQHTTSHYTFIAIRYTHYSALKHTANMLHTHCNTLQHTCTWRLGTSAWPNEWVVSDIWMSDIQGIIKCCTYAWGCCTYAWG